MAPLSLTNAGEDYPPLSALNDLLFCPRRCYLHRVEGIWLDNIHTVSGTLKHRRVHESFVTTEGNRRSVRGLRVISHTLRIQGVTDLVEFHQEVLFPVEYKLGKRRKWHNDEVQLCAQALCLEEMLKVTIPRGAIFHLKSRRRREVTFTSQLRDLTRDSVNQLHQILQQSVAPLPVLHKKCHHCSLYPLCMPKLLSSPRIYQQLAAELFSQPETES